MTDLVLGYGSLVADGGGVLATLHGHRRAWTVAMDNSVDLPGYKYYVDDAGLRPDVCVAFLDLVDDPRGAVDGVCRPVDAQELARLDRRERQYRRVEVTDRVTSAPGRIWTYVGLAAARERASRARTAGRLVVARAYRDAVTAAYDRLGDDHRARFDASTAPPGVPVLELRRVDVAG